MIPILSHNKPFYTKCKTDTKKHYNPKFFPDHKMKETPGSGVDENSPNMYRVGDYVYFENNGFGLFSVRRIEELNKTPNGKKLLFYVFVIV